MSAVVIIPTTGVPEVRKAIESVLSQSYHTKCYLVGDGNDFIGKVKVIAADYMGDKNFQVCYLPENVGANGFYGHRVYAAFPHLVGEDYVFFLDQDNWLDSNHVESCINTIKEKNVQWSYSLRKIYDKDGNFLCPDNCESLGKWKAWTNVNHIDTNTYCIPREIMIRLASVWHGGWGQDRVFLNAISQYFPQFDCNGIHSVNYRVGGNEGSVSKEFFDKGNEIMRERYDGEFPWIRKNI